MCSRLILYLDKPSENSSDENEEALAQVSELLDHRVGGKSRGNDTRQRQLPANGI